MARPCDICRHHRLKQIDADLLAGDPASVVARRYGASGEAMRRHARNHLRPRAARAAATLAASPPTVGQVLTAVEALPNPDTLDLGRLVHRSFADLRHAAETFRGEGDTRGLVVATDTVLRHAKTYAAPDAPKVDLAATLIPLVNTLRRVAQRHPSAAADIAGALEELERAVG